MSLKNLLKSKPGNKEQSHGESDYKPGTEARDLKNQLNQCANEAYKILQNKVLFSLPDRNKCKIIGITSAEPKENKTTTAINFSYTLAEAGKKVLTIDGNLKNNQLSEGMNISASSGLSDYLLNIANLGDCIYNSKVSGAWDIIPGGNIPSDTTELLCSNKMEQCFQETKKQYDYIILDLPPVNTDINTAGILRNTDGIIFVVKENKTSKKDVDQALESISYMEEKLLGFVLTNEKNWL